MRIEWMDLSDSELRAKLENRGARPDVAAAAAKYREAAAWAGWIEAVLKP